MNSLSVNLQGDAAWPDLVDREVIHLVEAKIEISVLPGGMQSGLPSVALRLELPDGRVVLAETSARLFCGAGRIISGAYPRLFSDDTVGRH